MNKQRSKTALVTGASGGIGAAIAQTLAREGLHVIAHANQNAAKAEEVVAAIQAAGGRAEAACFDLLDADAVQHFLAAQPDARIIDVLVNNAGVHDDAVFPGMSRAQWTRVLAVNVDGFFNITQPLLMPMIRQRWGRIITISSVAGITGNRGQVNYSAAKGALHAATKALSLEVANRGVTVNAVAPGVIETPMSEGLFDVARLKQLVPMQRTGTPQEVADLVAFLASDKAAYITGQIISINGGMV